MEHPILFISLILEMLHLPVPHGLVGKTLLAKIVSPHMTYTWLIMICLVIIPKLTLGKMEMIPGKAQNFWEAIIGGMEDFFADNMGREGARMMFPMLATFSLYIFVANLMGLIPGFTSPTSNLNITLGCTLIVFVTTHILGVKFHGIKYVKHFMGPIWWMAPFLAPIEIISHLSRIMSLSVRLFGNIMGKETLLAVLFMLGGAYFAPLPIMVLGVLVAFLQALVFVLLSVAYFSGAIEPAH